jgi:hypothetical protein
MLVIAVWEGVVFPCARCWEILLVGLGLQGGLMGQVIQFIADNPLEHSVYSVSRKTHPNNLLWHSD